MSQRDDNLAAWIDLNLVPGLGPAQYRALLSAFGLPRNVLSLRREQLARVVPDRIAAAITSRGREGAVEEGLAWAAQDGHAVITLADEAYPKLLLEIPDPPPLLYCRGNTAFLNAGSIAVVGSRNATPQGRSNAEQLAQALSHRGLTIVSGLALGIDAAAHRGGLSQPGSTIAVIGTGQDIVYPRGNAGLAQDIAAKGLLISEFPLGMPPLAANFPRRNRIIAGLSRGVLVVEAALASGSLITARMAADQGREVFAIPGSIQSPVSRGCHALIRQGAKLVESADDVLVELQPSLPPSSPFVSSPQISGAKGVLLQYIGYDPCDISTLATRSGLTAEAVSAMLLELELEGRVGSLPGGFYQRLM